MRWVRTIEKRMTISAFVMQRSPRKVLWLTVNRLRAMSTDELGR